MASPLATTCGQLIVGGFAGADPPAELERAVAEGRRAGLILFRRNAEDVEAIHDLARRLVDSTPADSPPILSVDQEGGRVQRLGSPVLQLPSMRALGARGQATVHAAAGELGRQLAAIGFNVDFAPVLDVDSNPKNPVIGDRSFSRSPEDVVTLGGAFVRGLQGAGILACGKHFPGHGDTDKDSHLDLPVVRHDRARLDAVELAPFAALSSELGSMMSAHIVFEALDADRPATLSPIVVTDLLRRTIGFRGLLFSDDLEMRALADRFRIEESAVAAIGAGCDVLLVCRDLDLQERTHAALVREAEKNPAFRARCEEAAARCLAARRRFPPRPAQSPKALWTALESDEAARLAAAIGRL